MGWRHETWIPLLILALGAAGCLYGMDAVRALKRENPLNLLPAIALGIALCVATGTPILWVRYHPSPWQAPYAMLFVLAVLLIECLRLALDSQARSMRWDGWSALKTAGLLLLCYLPSALCGLLRQASSNTPIEVYRVYLIASHVFRVLGGMTAWGIVRRGNRVAGIVLVILGATGIVGFEVMLHLNAGEFVETIGFLAARIIAGFLDPLCLSAYAFCLFGGVKCLLPEKKN